MGQSLNIRLEMLKLLEGKAGGTFHDRNEQGLSQWDLSHSGNKASNGN